MQKVIAAITLTFVLSAMAAIFGGYRINTTPSLPVGLWQLQRTAYERGDYVTACISNSSAVMINAINRGYLSDGLCPGGYAPLLKKIGAVAADTVEVTAEGLVVNDVLLDNTRAETATGAVWPAGLYAVAVGEVWLIANHPRSFDSRYFGPVQTAQILSGMKPILVR